LRVLLFSLLFLQTKSHQKFAAAGTDEGRGKNVAAVNGQEKRRR
jgi:hypothetical protein